MPKAEVLDPKGKEMKLFILTAESGIVYVMLKARTDGRKVKEEQQPTET